MRYNLHVERDDQFSTFHGSTTSEVQRDAFVSLHEGAFYTVDGKEPCGYCGTSSNPNDICGTCWSLMTGE